MVHAKISKKHFALVCYIIFGFHMVKAVETAMITIDIHQRSRTSYTAPCNGVVSHRTQTGGLRVFPDHTRKKTCKMNAPTIFVHHAAFYVCLSSRSDRSRCGWYTHLTNNGYFDYGKTRRPPIWAPCRKKRWRRFWKLWCISVMITLQAVRNWSETNNLKLLHSFNVH